MFSIKIHVISCNQQWLVHEHEIFGLRLDRRFRWYLDAVFKSGKRADFLKLGTSWWSNNYKSWTHSKFMQLVHNTYIHVHIFRLQDHFFLFHTFFWCRLTCPIWCEFYAKHLRYLEVVPVILLWAILVLSWDVYCFSTDYRLIRLLWNGRRFLQDFSLGLPRNRV